MSDGAGKYRRLLSAAADNISNAFYDAYVEVNCRFRSTAGLKVTVIREELGDCCNWCKDLAGIYSYDSAPKEVFARHLNCKCMVTTRTEKGKYQDVWSRKEYQSHREARKAREDEIKKEIEYKKAKGSDRSVPLKYNGPRRKEMLERAKTGRKAPGNGGVIAQKVADGELSLMLKRQKYLQHIKGTSQYNDEQKEHEIPLSYLSITEEEAQRQIFKLAGKGLVGGNGDREYVDADINIGYYWDGKDYNITNRVMILYGEKGAHLVPVKPWT